ncbi:unnamed protein product [Ectocarpus fasciculatus]
MNQSGQCLCGGVQFKVVDAPILFSALCHCRACARARGMSPVHLVGVPVAKFYIVEGEELLREAEGHGRMVHGNCSKCGTGVYQAPKDTGFRALFPATFQIQCGEEGKCCLLPSEYLPTVHVNYENRLFDWHDQLPKYKEHKSTGIRVNNEGEVITD